jgi:ribosomal protein S18 acetylase RimI-like enzyme
VLPIPASAHVLEIKGLAVSPAHRRRGVARALLHAAIDQARAAGAERLTLRVLAHNEGARALYASCGFEVEGVLRGFFRLDGRDVDDVLMTLALD